MFSQRKFLFPLPAYQNHMVALFAFSHVISGAFSYRQAYVFAQPQRIGNIYVRTYTNPFQLAFQGFYFCLLYTYTYFGTTPNVFGADF